MPLWQVLALGFGLVLVIEGLVLAIAPDLYERLAEMMRETSLEARRSLGLVVVALGVGLVWLSYG